MSVVDIGGVGAGAGWGRGVDVVDDVVDAVVDVGVGQRKRQKVEQVRKQRRAFLLLLPAAYEAAAEPMVAAVPTKANDGQRSTCTPSLRAARWTSLSRPAWPRLPTAFSALASDAMRYRIDKRHQGPVEMRAGKHH